jgi:hypothetical protein
MNKRCVGTGSVLDTLGTLRGIVVCPSGLPGLHPASKIVRGEFLIGTGTSTTVSVRVKLVKTFTHIYTHTHTHTHSHTRTHSHWPPSGDLFHHTDFS